MPIQLCRNTYIYADLGFPIHVCAWLMFNCIIVIKNDEETGLFMSDNIGSYGYN